MNEAQAARQDPGEQAANVYSQRERVEPEIEDSDESDESDESEDSDDREFESESSVDEHERGWDDEEALRERAVELLSQVRQRIRRQPLTAAGGAFILGFAVGNGVPKFLARAGIAIGLRMVMQRMFDRSELFADQQ
jgi:hypothetical protein